MGLHCDVWILPASVLAVLLEALPHQQQGKIEGRVKCCVLLLRLASKHKLQNNYPTLVGFLELENAEDGQGKRCGVPRRLAMGREAKSTYGTGRRGTHRLMALVGSDLGLIKRIA